MVRETGFDTTGTRALVCAATTARNTGTTEALSRIIISARRVHRIERWGSDGCLALENCVYRRQDGESGERGGGEAAHDGAGEGRRLRAAFTEADGHGRHAEDHGRRGHEDGAQAASGAFPDGVEERPAFVAPAFGESDQQNRVGHR